MHGRFALRPQKVWLRRALFHMHRWVGLGLGVYIVVISVSGSAVVFRREMDKKFCPQIITVAPAGKRLTDADLAAAARAAFSRFGFDKPAVEIRPSVSRDHAVEVWLTAGTRHIEHLFDPYTGRDLGDAVACEPAFVTSMVDFHAELLGGHTGRLVNGIGAVCVILMCLTGAVIWWPGVARWRRSLTLRLNSSWRRLTWDLHGLIGLWMFLLILMWAFTGVYFAFPGPVSEAIDSFTNHGNETAASQSLEMALDWVVRLHFGRTFGLWVKVLWVLLGLAPVAMFITGVLMWWNRVLRRALHRRVNTRTVGSSPDSTVRTITKTHA